MPAAEWAVQRRLDDLVGKLEPKFGDLRGRVEVLPRPGVTFAMIGGAEPAKAAISGLSHALRMPELYRRWGITPPRGGLLYGPPGNGKTLLAKALATLSEALFYHFRLATLTSKVGPLAVEVIKEVFQLASSEGKGVLFFEDAEALSFEHILPPERAREASAPLIIGICELLDGLRSLPVAPRRRLDQPSRRDRLAPDRPGPLGPPHRGAAARWPRPPRDRRDPAQARGGAGRASAVRADRRRRPLVSRLAGMSGGEVAEVIRRALEDKVHLSGAGQEAGLVRTADLVTAVDESRRVRDVVVKIRYGQYL